MIFRNRIENLDYDVIQTVETSLKNFTDTFIKAISDITVIKDKKILLDRLKKDIELDLKANSLFPNDIEFNYSDESYYEYCLSEVAQYKIKSMPVEIKTNDRDYNIIKAIENWIIKT